MAARARLTDQGIRAELAKAKQTGKPRWLADGLIAKGKGGLQLYAASTGGRWYWRYSKADGSKVRVPLGPQAFERREGALTLPEARVKVDQLAALYQRPESRDVRAFAEAERQRADDEKRNAEATGRQRLEAEAREAAEVARQRDAAAKFTLSALFKVYTTGLQAAGRPSHYDAANLFANHVEGVHPDLARKPAGEVTPRDVVTILRTLVEKGHGRSAAKLRSYLRACYSRAARAMLDPDAPSAFLPFAVQSNPVAETGALSRYNVALERALSEAELRAFWQAVKETPNGPVHDALRLLLLLGGQRPAQLVRATVADIDCDAQMLRLRDPKGRRQQARVHLLPLAAAAEVVVRRCLDRAKKQGSAYLLSTHGKAPLRPETLTAACNTIVTALLAKSDEERVISAPFQLRDLRRTVETRMAALGVSRELRAQLQSHVLGGVQSRHYDRHLYVDEKRAALEAWAAFLETKPAGNVQSIRGRKRA